MSTPSAPTGITFALPNLRDPSQRIRIRPVQPDDGEEVHIVHKAALILDHLANRTYLRFNERTWNSVMLNALEYYVSFPRSLKEKMPYDLDVQVLQEDNLFHGRPDETSDMFANCPTQLHLVELLRERITNMRSAAQSTAQAAPATSALRRGKLGIYIPDIVSKKTAARDRVPPVSNPPLCDVVSLVVEFKVTVLNHLGNRWVVQIDPRADIDMDRDDDEVLDLLADDNVSHVSLSTAGDNEDRAFDKDHTLKWRAGLSKLVVYMLTSSECWGTYLGYLVNHTKFARVVLVRRTEEQTVFAVECSDTFLANHPTSMPMHQFLQADYASHLPHDLAHEQGGFDTDALSRLVGITDLSFRLLLPGPEAQIQAPFSRLAPIDLESCPVAKEIIDRAREMEVTDRAEVLKLSRAELQRASKRKSAASTAVASKTGRRDDPDHGDADDDNRGGGPGRMTRSKTAKSKSRQTGMTVGKQPPPSVKSVPMGANPPVDSMATASRQDAFHPTLPTFRSLPSLAAPVGVSLPRSTSVPTDIASGTPPPAAPATITPDALGRLQRSTESEGDPSALSRIASWRAGHDANHDPVPDLASTSSAEPSDECDAESSASDNDPITYLVETQVFLDLIKSRNIAAVMVSVSQMDTLLTQVRASVVPAAASE